MIRVKGHSWQIRCSHFAAVLAVGALLGFVAPRVRAAVVAAADPFDDYLRDSDVTPDELKTAMKQLIEERREIRKFLVPTGTIVPFAASEPPPGWAMCDGAAVDPADPSYADLSSVLGDAWGRKRTVRADGTQYDAFLLPDLRGRFLRGWDHGSGNDRDAKRRTPIAERGSEGDNVGSLQSDATRRPNSPFTTGIQSTGHSHSATTTGQFQQGPNSFGSGDSRGVSGRATVKLGNQNSDHTHDILGGGDRETRPTNVSVNYIIKL